MLDYQ
jgi:hypothetical protein